MSGMGPIISRLPQIRNIGVVREIKQGEGRVGVTPAGVAAFTGMDRTVYVEKDAGLRSGFSNQSYHDAGAKILTGPAAVWKNADMVIKVKEPLRYPVNEFDFLRPDLVLFTYLHLASGLDLARDTAASGVCGFAFETAQKEDGSIPMLACMSEIAGRMAPMEASAIGAPNGAMGLLMSGIPEIAERQNMLVLGGGNVGANAAMISLKLGANIRILDINEDRVWNNLERLAANNENYFDLLSFGHRATKGSNFVEVGPSNEASITEGLDWAHTIIGAALRPGAPAPLLIGSDHFYAIQSGKIIVDVAVDQGGITSHTTATTHEKPTFIVDREGSVHPYGDIDTPGTVMYCVANMPGKHARTSTLSLTARTLPYALAMAGGWESAFEQYPELAKGINTLSGYLTLQEVAEPLGLMGIFKPLSGF